MYLFGVDRHTLAGLKISTVDLEKLLSNKNVKVYKEGETITLRDTKTGEELEFATILVKDNKYFKNLVVGCKVNEGFKVEYVHLDVFVSSPDSCNLIPLNQEKLVEKHLELQSYILEEYGIGLKFGQAHYSFLEMNRTVELIEDAELYREVLKLMGLIAPKKYKSKNFWTDENNQIRGVFLENNSVKIKVYNKTKQLLEEYHIILANTYLRIEIVLKDTRKIKEVFNTTLVSEISLSDMEKYYVDTINQDIFKKIDKYIKDCNRELKKVAKEEQDKDMRKWTRSFLLRACGNRINNDLDLVFDIEQVLEIIKKKTGKNYKRTLKRLEKDIEEKSYKQKNLERYSEIKSKILCL